MTYQFPKANTEAIVKGISRAVYAPVEKDGLTSFEPVSYTHLTLPTSSQV